MKNCSRCKALKPFEEFYLKKGKPDSWCKACHKQETGKYQKTQAGKNVQRRKYLRTMADPVARAERRRYMRNEAAKRRRNKSPIIKRAEADRMRDWRLAKPWEAAVRGARARAVLKKIGFDLSYEWGAENYTGFCALTGLAFEPQIGRQASRSPSLDRIDSAKGYMRNNCRFVLGAINSLKGNGTDEEMYSIAESLVKMRVCSHR